jgi:hypothetical protein
MTEHKADEPRFYFPFSILTSQFSAPRSQAEIHPIRLGEDRQLSCLDRNENRENLRPDPDPA